MSIVQAIILGIVEGLTEFLPISSTAHLLIANRLLGISPNEFTASFDIYIQLGAILAVLVLFGKKLFLQWKTFMIVAAAFIPTAIIGFVLYKSIKQILRGDLLIVALTLLIGGVILIIFEYWYKKQANPDHPISYRRAVIIGLCQALAVIPGVSRSGATIVGGLALGISRKDIVEFSFLLAVPTMVAATGLDLFKNASSFSQGEWLLIALGFVSTFITALLAIKWFITFVQNHSFSWFGIYRILAGLLILLFLL